jgi:hypothetical protein
MPLWLLLLAGLGVYFSIHYEEVSGETGQGRIIGFSLTTPALVCLLWFVLSLLGYIGGAYYWRKSGKNP